MFYERDGIRLWDLCILAACVVMGIVTAIGTEQLQAMTQYRTPDINDVYADMKGMAPGCIGVLIYIAIKKRIGQK
jgi:VanZ family protein